MRTQLVQCTLSSLHHEMSAAAAATTAVLLALCARGSASAALDACLHR